MKLIKRFFTVLILLNITVLSTPKKVAAQGGAVNFQVFYDELSPYGTWVQSPQYGYVWAPNEGPGFVPYSTNGYWVFTDEGWTWVSNYSWGWAPFHYGRWYTDDVYGPIWVPDNEWGPGWVTWRRSEGYYGWAPMGPGVSITVAYSNSYVVPSNRWCFVRERDFGRRDIYRRYVDRSRNVTIINNSTVINNVRHDPSSNARFNAGPNREEVQRRSGRQIAQVSLKENNRPGQTVDNKELHLYRPRVEGNNNRSGANSPAPAKAVRDVKELKPAAERGNGNNPTYTNGRGGNNKNPGTRDNKGNQQPQPNTPGRQTDAPTYTRPGQKNGQTPNQPTNQGGQNRPDRRTDIPQQPASQPQRDNNLPIQPPKAEMPNQQPVKQPARDNSNNDPIYSRPNQRQPQQRPAQQPNQPVQQPQRQPQQPQQPQRQPEMPRQQPQPQPQPQRQPEAPRQQPERQQQPQRQPETPRQEQPQQQPQREPEISRPPSQPQQQEPQHMPQQQGGNGGHRPH